MNSHRSFSTLVRTALLTLAVSAPVMCHGAGSHRSGHETTVFKQSHREKHELPRHHKRPTGHVARPNRQDHGNGMFKYAHRGKHKLHKHDRHYKRHGKYGRHHSRRHAHSTGHRHVLKPYRSSSYLTYRSPLYLDDYWYGGSDIVIRYRFGD